MTGFGEVWEVWFGLSDKYHGDGPETIWESFEYAVKNYNLPFYFQSIWADGFPVIKVLSVDFDKQGMVHVKFDGHFETTHYTGSREVWFKLFPINLENL